MRDNSRVISGFILAILMPVQFAAAQWVWTPETGRFINLDNLPKETPELQVEHARTLLLEGEYQEAMRETEKFDDFYGDTELADENQFLQGEIELARGDYEDAAEQFQQVVVNYPESELFDEVIEKQYEAGDALFERGVARMEDRDERPWYFIKWRPFQKRPLKKAIDVYSMVIENQPFTSAAAEAQYKIGLCHYTLEEYIEAAFEYRRVIEEYPGSAYVADAAYGLAKCYEGSSLPPAYDQAPSRLTVNAIDEFRVRFPTDPRNEELDEVREDMRERIATQRLQTAEYYERRRLFDSARIYYRLLVEEFDGTDAAESARQWLAENPAPEDRLPAVPAASF